MENKEKGLAYLENMVTYNTQLVNKLTEYKEKLPKEGRAYDGLQTLLIGGIYQSLFLIKEAKKTAKEIFNVELDIQENLVNELSNLKHTFYIENDKVKNISGYTIEEIIREIEKIPNGSKNT